MDFLNGKIYICALNNCSSVQGASEPVTLHAFTVSPEETLPELIVADTSRAETGVPVTPALGVLIGMVAGHALVAVCIILVMRLQHGSRRGGYRVHTFTLLLSLILSHFHFFTFSLSHFHFHF